MYTNTEKSLFIFYSLPTNIVPKDEFLFMSEVFRTDFKIRLLFLDYKTKNISFPKIRINHLLKTSKLPRLIKAVIVFLKLLAISFNERPDILRSYDLIPNFFAVLYGKLIQIPTVISIHSSPRIKWQMEKMKKLEFSLFSKIEEFVLHSADHIIAVSQSVKEYAIKHGANADKIKIIYRGVDTMKFKPTNAKERQVPTITNIGRLAPEKQVKYLLYAFKIVRNEINAKLVILGDGEERNKLDAIAQRLKIIDHVEFKGFVPHSAVKDYLNNSQIFILPSTAAEGCPKALLEAMAMKNAVVATDISPLNEMIDHKINGLLFPDRNYKILAEYILKLLKDYKLREELGENARKKILRMFQRNKLIKSEFLFLRKVCESSFKKTVY